MAKKWAKVKTQNWKSMTGRDKNPDNSAIEQQQAAEARKAATRDSINRIFQDPEKVAARQKQYDDQREANFGLNKRYLDEDVADTRRAQRFAAMDRGVLGGSSDLDQQVDIDRTYKQGLIDAGQQADAMRRAWAGADEQARLSLLSSAETGMDEKTAAENAQRSLDRTLSDAYGQAQGRSIGDMFAGAADAYDQWRYRQGQQSAQGQVYGGYGQPRRRQNYESIFNW